MTGEPGRAAFLRFRELERQLRESLECDRDVRSAWGWVARNLERVYSGDLLPGTGGLANLGRGLDDKWVSDRSHRRSGQLSREFGEGLGLPPGSWAAGPAPGWTAAVADVAPGWRGRAAGRYPERPGGELPRREGWADATSCSNGVAALRQALDAEPDGELLVVLLDACLVPLHTRVLPPQRLSLEPLDRAVSAAPRSAATLRELTAFRSGLAAGFGHPPRETGTAAGWDEALAERAPSWLAAAARRRALVERRAGPLDLPPVPALLDAPGWQAAGTLRELEQAVREALPGADDERELDAWLRPLYAGTALPGPDVGPLALASERAAVPAATLAETVGTGLGTPPGAWRPEPATGWVDALTAVAPAWLEAADLRAARASGVRDRLRAWLSRA